MPREKIPAFGLEEITRQIESERANDSYFFIISMTAPFRYVVNGGNPELSGKSFSDSLAIFETYFPGGGKYFTEAHEKTRQTAAEGGGFYFYKWKANPTSPIIWKLAYATPFTFEGESYVLAIGKEFANPALLAILKIVARCHETSVRAGDLSAPEMNAEITSVLKTSPEPSLERREDTFYVQPSMGRLQIGFEIILDTFRKIQSVCFCNMV